MPILKIGGVDADVGIREELEQFPWHRPRWTSEKLIAASPFRYDRTPSFFVNLDGEYAGTWADSGAYDADYESGNFVKLLAFLRDETYEETADYLINMYGVNKAHNSNDLRLPTLCLPKHKKPTVLAESVLKAYAYNHPYLYNRGISEKVQRFMGVGYDRQANAITIPWRYANGKLANVKYRKVQGKAFWYRKGAEPVRHLVYGIDKVYRHGLSEVYICEAEIDVMSVYTAGKPAIAIGGASISDKQIELIRKSPIERAVLALDNDKAGEKVKRQIIDAIKGAVELREVLPFPSGVKDVNEALVSGGVDELERTLKKTKRVDSVLTFSFR